MKESLLNLLEAQEIDSEIDGLERARKEYPKEIADLRGEIETLEKNVADTEETLKNIDTKRALIEDEIAAEKDALSKKEARLLETKTNKEYNAVQHEIENAREKIDNLETEDLELMNETDELAPKLEELKETLETVRMENTGKIDELQEKFDSIESDIATLANKRDRSLDGTNQRALNVYKRLRTGKSGLAVAKVDKNKHSCTGCFKQLPPQKVLEVRRGERLIFCESCGRVLVWDWRESDD